MERALAESNLEKLRTTLEESTANEHVQELQQFHQELMNQTRIYEKAKQEVQAMHERNAELRETEQRLSKELNEVEALQNEEEEQAGVTGFRDVNAELEKASKDTMSLNERKSQTLAEISSTVQRIALVLEAKQKELEPKVQDLKTARAQYQEFTERYDYEKKAYQELEQKSKADNEGLEKESAKLQDELAEKEKQYSEICASNKILQANINCCTSDSLNNLEAKVTEQEQLLNDLRKQHDGMKGREEFSSSQKVMISNLIKLLELKAQCIG
jgi:chromosome segregation ATPase